MARSDHLEVNCALRLVKHHGIESDNGQVIHYVKNFSTRRYTICETSKEEFEGGYRSRVVKYSQEDPPDVVIKRARQGLGKEGDYNLVTDQCEHGAVYNKTGRAESHQVNYHNEIGRSLRPPGLLSVAGRLIFGAPKTESIRGYKNRW